MTVVVVVSGEMEASKTLRGCLCSCLVRHGRSRELQLVLQSGEGAIGVQRAFESKRDFFVQFLKCFGFFYLCNGRHITGHSYAHPSGTSGRMNVRLCAGRCTDKKSQNISEIEQIAPKGFTLRRTLSAVCERSSQNGAFLFNF